MVISKNLSKEEIMKIKYYRYDYCEKLVQRTKPLNDALKAQDKELIEFLGANEIVLVDRPIKDIVDAANYLTTDMGYKHWLIEGGISSYKEYLDDLVLPAPADVFVLSVLKGRSGPWLGNSFTGMDQILKKYDLVNNPRDIDTDVGKLSIYAMVRKDSF